MKFLALLLFSAGVLAYAQGLPSLALSHAHAQAHAHVVQYSCNTSEIESLIDGVLSNASVVVEDVRVDINTMYLNIDDCVEEYLSTLDLTTLSTCVTDVVQNTTSEIKTTVTDFVNESESTVQEVVQLIQQCANP